MPSPISCWSLRDYQTRKFEGGDPNCDHQVFWGGHGEASKLQLGNRETSTVQARDICPKCGAKRVDEQLGLEPTF
jgi:hypothetical protein